MLSWLGKLLRGAPAGVSARDEVAALLQEALAHRQAGRNGDARLPFSWALGCAMLTL